MYNRMMKPGHVGPVICLKGYIMRYLDTSERCIVSHLVKAIVGRGLVVSVHDGEEWALVCSSDAEAISGWVGETDATTFRVRNPSLLDANGKPQTLGQIYLIAGNGCDIIADYSDEPALAGIVKAAEELADRLRDAGA